MIKPPIEELLKETPGRFALVITASRRARDINSYFNQLVKVSVHIHLHKFKV